MKMSRQLGMAAMSLYFAVSAMAAQPVTLYEVSGVKVTDQDVYAELTRAPLEARENALSNPDTITAIAKTLAARRLLAQQAQKSGLASEPKIQAIVRLAEERVLSDARMVQFDEAHKPDAKAIDEYARSVYKANTTAFQAPAETHVRHILIEGDTPEAKAKADKLAAQLKSGASFEKLAKENSDDKGSASKGGDLGFASAGRFVPEFQKGVDGLTKNGEISAPVKSQFGWHIIQLVDKRAAHAMTYEEVADRLRADATNRLLSGKRQEMTASLVKDAKVHEDAIKAMGALVSTKAPGATENKASESK